MTKQNVDSLQPQKEEIITPQPTPTEEKKVLPQMRKIIIETDGNVAKFTTLEVAGNLELLGILQGLLDAIKKA